MNNVVSQEQYITQIKERLINNGFDIRETAPNESFDFACLAKKTKFELIRFGFFSTIIIISRFMSPGLSDLKKYSSVCYKIARKSVRIHPPRGLMYGFLCLPVAVTENLDKKTCVSVKRLDIPKHWAAFERLVVFNVAGSELYYSEKRPFWGSFYHALDESIINYLLYIDREQDSSKQA